VPSLCQIQNYTARLRARMMYMACSQRNTQTNSIASSSNSSSQGRKRGRPRKSLPNVSLLNNFFVKHLFQALLQVSDSDSTENPFQELEKYLFGSNSTPTPTKRVHLDYEFVREFPSLNEFKQWWDETGSQGLMHNSSYTNSMYETVDIYR
jgi:hypothetical protein